MRFNNDLTMRFNNHIDDSYHTLSNSLKKKEDHIIIMYTLIIIKIYVLALKYNSTFFLIFKHKTCTETSAQSFWSIL